MQPLELRDEFLAKHMRGTAIELRNKQNTGWAQKGPGDLLAITYPTSDVQRSLEAVSAAMPGKAIVFLGQRGPGKSHIMALLHHAVESPDAVMQWASEWGAKLGADKLSQLKLQTRFHPISETLSNQEYANIWDLIFDRHPRVVITARARADGMIKEAWNMLCLPPPRKEREPTETPPDPMLPSGLARLSLPSYHTDLCRSNDSRDLLAVYWRLGETYSAPKGLRAYPECIQRDNWGLDGGGELSIIGWKWRFSPMRA